MHQHNVPMVLQLRAVCVVCVCVRWVVNDGRCMMCEAMLGNVMWPYNRRANMSDEEW